MPFYANGTLNPDERALVERAVATDKALASELEELRMLRNAFKDLPDDAPAPDTEERLQKVMAKIAGLSQLSETDT